MGYIPEWVPVARVGMLVVLIGTIVVIRWLDQETDWGRTRRSRFVLGVPWGTVVSSLVVLAVYFFLQGGWGHWAKPLTIPYRSWSYLYPLGTITSAFAHNGPNHLVGNIIGTLVLGTLAEYSWGHFPETQGRTTFSSWGTNPYFRAFVWFPGGVLLVGLLTSVFSWGPIIGFSGVVFAFAGFALLRYPLLTIVAVEADDVIRITYRAAREPVLVRQAEPQFVEPWWAGIAVQGHVLGLFLGIVAGAIVLRHRSVRPSRLWAGTLVLATSLSVWALWWFRGNQEFVLLRALGVSFVLLLALLVTLGLWAREHETAVLGVPARHVGLLLLVFPLLVIGMVAVPLNLTSVAANGHTQTAVITTGDYTIGYAENVTNQQTNVVNISVFGESTAITSSGVIVRSQQRHLWSEAFSKSRLRFAGRGTVVVGGVGWREEIRVRRDGWNVQGNRSVYRVWLREPAGDWQLAFQSAPATADPVIAGRKLTIQPGPTNYRVAVRANNSTLATHPLPTRNETVIVGGLRVTREVNDIYATINETKVRIASRERYQGQKD